jgi:effector-binding domain-containing protein
MNHTGVTNAFINHSAKPFHMEQQGYKVAGPLRTSYIDGAWNQEDPEQWLSVIQIPIE